jgi:hypothetical protein
MKNNQIVKTVYEASRTQTPIKANIRLKKNGQFSSVEGVVKEIKINRFGQPYILVQPQNKHLQSVVLANIMSVQKRPSAEQLQRMIAERAYYNAKQHNFMSNPTEDWLTAEREVKSVIQVR